jgi:proline dehydrogenase
MSLINKIIILFMPIIPKVILKIFSRPYIAGSHLQDAILKVKELNSRGAVATIDVLGEGSNDRQNCDYAIYEYFNILDTIYREKLDCNISLKPSHLGLAIDKNLAYQNIRRILEKAKKMKIFVRLDMEDASCTTNTIDMYLRLTKNFPNVGIAIQAYLHRSIDDVKRLAKTKANFRLCKGIYIESRKIAFKDPEVINNNFTQLIEIALEKKCYVGIATHDEKMIWHGLHIIKQLKLKQKDYEFQMLLGVDEEMRDILINAGHKVRIYVPYGQEWFAYSKRRLKENPKIALYVLKALFKLRK